MLPDPNDRIIASERQHSYLPRWVKLAVAGVSLAVFVVFVGYAYLGRSGSPDGEVPLIRADQQPMKMRPDDPGGMDVPHQDKEIYNRMARDGAEPPGPRVERLLPPPESPLPRPSTAPAPEAAIPPSAVATAPPGAAEAPAAPAPRAEAAKPAPAPQPLTAAPPAQPQQAPTRQAAVPSPAPASKPTQSAGRFRVQVASMRTAEDAARAADQLKRSHPDLLGKLAINVVRADLGSRGTFYRVQAGPLADEGDAKNLCQKLSAKKVGCIIVRP